MLVSSGQTAQANVGFTPFTIADTLVVDQSRIASRFQLPPGSPGTPPYNGGIAEVVLVGVSPASVDPVAWLFAPQGQKPSVDAYGFVASRAQAGQSAVKNKNWRS